MSTIRILPRHDGVMQQAVSRFGRLGAAIVLGTLGVLAAAVPSWHDAGLRWLPLALITPLVLWCALPVHISAIRGLLRGTWTPDIIATTGIWAAYAWSIHAVATERTNTHLVPVALATALMVTVQCISEETGSGEPYGSPPAWLVPGLLLAAVATMAAWWIVEGASTASTTTLSVLLVASPAALQLAGPAALLVGARRGATLGMTVSGTDASAASCRIDTIVLDKDGTVTTGELTVVSIDPIDPDHERNMRWFAGALEHTSEHRIGRAIAKLSARGRVTNIVHQPGLGISGSVDRHPVRVGSPSWIGTEVGVDLGTHVGVEVDGRVLGSITVADTLRADAREGVDGLRELGLDTILVSDGRQPDTEDLAHRAGITTCHSETGSEQRLALVHRLQAEGRVVAMVGGRGPNAAAMQAADLALSEGEDAPTGGIALADISVLNTSRAIGLSRATSTATLTNRRWAVAGMLTPLPFAAAGLIDPEYAALFALACSVGVVLNSLRMPRLERPG